MSYITENSVQVVTATKRNADGEPLQKQVRTDMMQVERILNPSVLGQAPHPLTISASKKKNKKSKTKQSKKINGIGSITEKAARCDVGSALGNAASGLTFGQILQGDAFRVQ